MRNHEYRKLLSTIAQEITLKELEIMKFLCRDIIPYTRSHTIMKEDILAEVFEFFGKLEAQSKLGIDELDWMKDMLVHLKREALVLEVTDFELKRVVYLSSLGDGERERETNQTTRSQQEENQEEDQRRRSEPEVREEQNVATGNQNNKVPNKSEKHEHLDNDDDDGGGIEKKATKKFTNEQLNYFRLCSVITHDVLEGLRTVFKQQWNALYQATHGQWLDAPKNATDFLSMQSPRNQRRNARLLTIMANGNTNEWDCTCLFYAILYSDCLWPFLNTTVKKNVNELREIRNEVFIVTADGRLADVKFYDFMRKISAALKALALDTTQVDEMRTQKTFVTEELSRFQQQLNIEKKRYAKLHSFCVLPPKPSHDTTHRLAEVTKINQEMEKLRSTKKNETTVIYLSGNPGCGKSEIARQIGNNYFNKIPEDTGQLTFVFTLDATNIDTLLHSYLDFAARLSCDKDSLTRIVTMKDLSPKDKIKKLKSLINPKVHIYSWWLIIVDNVNDLKLASKYLPQAGEKTSGDGQILVVTQDSQSIPLDSYTYHYSSLK